MSDATKEIKKKYEELGGRNGFLGAPVNPQALELTSDIPAHQHYEHGVICYSPLTGAHEVHGAILAKYKALPKKLRNKFGLPTSDEIRAPGDYIRYSTFQGGTIIWSQDAGAWELYGAINEKWLSLTEEVRHTLGYPNTVQIRTPDGIGLCNHFSNGAIYWTRNLGAHLVYGRIYAKWRDLGWEPSIGYPTDDVTMLVLPGGSPSGEVGPFQNATLYARMGYALVYTVSGEFLRVLRLHGGERINGFPQSDAFAVAGGRVQSFDFGMILSKTGLGTRYIPREIFGEYIRMNSCQGCLGFPRSDYMPVPGVAGHFYQLFEHGRIDFDSTTRNATSHCDTPTPIGDRGTPTRETDILLERLPFLGGLEHYQGRFIGRAVRLQNNSGRDFVFIKSNQNPVWVLLNYAVLNSDGTRVVPENAYITVRNRGSVNAADLGLGEYPVINAGLLSISGGGGPDGAGSYSLHIWY